MVGKHLVRRALFLGEIYRLEPPASSPTKFPGLAKWPVDGAARLAGLEVMRGHLWAPGHQTTGCKGPVKTDAEP